MFKTDEWYEFSLRISTGSDINRLGYQQTRGHGDRIDPQSVFRYERRERWEKGAIRAESKKTLGPNGVVVFRRKYPENSADLTALNVSVTRHLAGVRTSFGDPTMASFGAMLGLKPVAYNLMRLKCLQGSRQCSQP